MGCSLNPKGWCIGTAYGPFSTIWKIQVCFFFLVVVVGHSSFHMVKRNLSVSFNFPVHLQATKHQIDPSAILSYPHNNVCFMSPVLGGVDFCIIPLYRLVPLFQRGTRYTVYGIPVYLIYKKQSRNNCFKFFFQKKLYLYCHFVVISKLKQLHNSSALLPRSLT